MLHLAIICMVCAVLAPIEGTALTGVNNNKPNVFCRADEREQRQRGKFFPGLYNADVKNCSDCAEQRVAGRTHCTFYNNVTKQCQLSRTLCSFRKKFPDRRKRNPGARVESAVRKRSIYKLVKSKGMVMMKKVTGSSVKKPEASKLTFYERSKLRRLKKVGTKRKKRRTRTGHLDKVETDDDLDMDKRIEKLVGRIALENSRTQDSSLVGSATEPVRVMDVRHSEDSTKGLAFPFLDNIKQMFRISREYFDSKRDSRDKRDVTIPIRSSHTTSRRDSDDTKSTRLRRNLPRRFILSKLRKNGNRLGGWTSALNSPYRVPFSAVKRKRRRRKRDHRHRRSRLGSSSKHKSRPLNDQKYSHHKTDYNDSKLNEDNETDSTGLKTPENGSRLPITTGLPASFSWINRRNNFNMTDSESLAYGRGNGTVRGSNVLDDHTNRHFFHHPLEKSIRRGDAKRYDDKRFADSRKLLTSGRYLKIRHALRNYIHDNNHWALKKRILMDRKKRCEGKSCNMLHRCWRSAPLLCIPYIRKGQDDLLKYVIKTLQNMLAKPMPRKIDIFDKIKFKPCVSSTEATYDDIMPACERESTTEATTTTCAPTTTTITPKPDTSSVSPSTVAPSLATLQSIQLYPNPTTTESTTEPTTEPTTESTTNCPPVEPVTAYGSSISCVVQSSVCSPPSNTCPPPVTTLPPATTLQPPTSLQPVTQPPTPTPPPSITTTTTTCAPISQNTYALLIVGTSSTIFSATEPSTIEPIPTSGKDCSKDSDNGPTDTPVLQETEPSAPMPQQQQTPIPISYFQVTIEDYKSGDPDPPENSVTPPQTTPNSAQTSTTQGCYTFPTPPPNKVTPRDLVQVQTIVSPHFAASPTQEIETPTTPNTPQWYVSENPIEKSEILTFTTLQCTSDPNLYYNYYKPFTPAPSYGQPRPSNPKQRERHRSPYLYVYKPNVVPTQASALKMGSMTGLPLQYDLSYNDKVKPTRDLYESDTMMDYLPGLDPREQKYVREKMFLGPMDKIRSREEENLFPGDPFSYRFSDTTDRYTPKVMKPKLFHKKFLKFMRRNNRKLGPNYNFDGVGPYPRNHQTYDEKYDGYDSPEMSGKELNEGLRKVLKKNHKREKREVFYRDSYPWSKNSDNYDDYFDDSHYNDQYPENLFFPKLNLETSHWARKREDQNSSTPGTYGLFSELAEMAALSSNATEKVSELPINTTSTESATNATVTNPVTSPQMGLIDKIDNEPRNGYDNSPDPTPSMMSVGYTTTPKRIPATTSGDTTTPNLISTTLDNKGSRKSKEVEKVQIVDSGKPDREVGSNHGIEAGEEQIMTTLRAASIVKGPKKLFTKPAPRVYTKVFPDSLANELETNETPPAPTTPKTDKTTTTVVQTLATPDVRLQLLAVCEGYLEIVKLIKAQNQSLEEELDSDLSQYCENIISQSFNLPADNVINKTKKPESSSSTTMTSTTTVATATTTTTATPQTPSKNSNRLVSKRRTYDRYRSDKDGISRQDLRAKVVVDILRSPVYKKEVATYADHNNFYANGRKMKRRNSQPLKMDGREMPSRRYRCRERAKKDFLRNQRKELRRKENMKETFSRKRISEEEMELLHLLRQRKRALLSWLFNTRENQMEPSDQEETEYLDDDEYYTVTADTTEDSGTITPKGDQETSESTTETTSYTNDDIFPVYAKRYGYDRGGELREVEVFWRRLNEETHEKKIFKNRSVLALLLTSPRAPYMRRRESKFVGGNAYEADEMSEIQSKSDDRAGFVDPYPSSNDTPVNTSAPPPCLSTTPYCVSFISEFKECSMTTCTTMSTTASSTTSLVNTTPTATEPATEPTTVSTATTTIEHQTESETVRTNNSSKKNQTYIFMRKPDPSTIVGSPPNSTTGHKNSTHKMSRKLEIAKDIFQEYSIEFLNYAVYILPVMFTILFIMCCLCCFLQILNSRGGGRRTKKKKILMSTVEDFDTTGDSDGETKIRKKKKWKKSLKSDVDCENLENRRLGSFWSVLKINSRGKQRRDTGDETSTPTEKRRSFLQFLKGKKGDGKPEELASLSYPPPCEQDEISDEEARISREANDHHAEFDSEMKEPVHRETIQIDERREIITLLEELKRIELENLEETKNKKPVCVQYMTQEEEKTVFTKTPDVPSSYQTDKHFPSDPFNDKRFPNPPTEDPPEDAGELMELVPYGGGGGGDYTERKNDSLRRSDFRTNGGGRCERFFKMFPSSGDGMNFAKNGNGNEIYTYTKLKDICTDTRDELAGGNGNANKNLSGDVSDNFPPYSIQRDERTDIVDEMENLKRQLNKKKNVRLKDNGVLCRL